MGLLRRHLWVIPVAAVVFSTAGCVGSSNANQVIAEIQDRPFSERASDTCQEWDGGYAVSAADIERAVDSTLAEVREIEEQLGVTGDSNVESGEPATYAAICLVSGDNADRLGAGLLLYYQLDDGGGLFLAKM